MSTLAEEACHTSTNVAENISGAGSPWKIGYQVGERGEREEAGRDPGRAGGDDIAIDGSFDAGTKAAVVDVQESAGLDADGVMGSATWVAPDALTEEPGWEDEEAEGEEEEDEPSAGKFPARSHVLRGGAPNHVDCPPRCVVPSPCSSSRSPWVSRHAKEMCSCPLQRAAQVARVVT